MTAAPKALILAGDGLNCEHETAYALELAGARPQIRHVNMLFDNPRELLDYSLLAIPGGFSFGDEVSSGKLLAIKLQHCLGDLLQEFVARKSPVIGICNGFQTLVKLGLLPRFKAGQQQVTLTHNRQRRFINQWVRLVPNAPSIFFKGLEQEELQLPIRHGEGRLVLPDNDDAALIDAHISLQYKQDVNGSYKQTAGLCLNEDDGLVLGLMPHPEAFVRWTQHPNWTGLPASETDGKTPTGLRIFQNMVEAAR